VSHKAPRTSKSSTAEGEGATKSAVRRVSRPASGESVVSGLAGARKAPMPGKIRPMLASLAEQPFDSPDWLFEIKWDGYRVDAFIENNGVRLVSRNHNDLTGQYPELHGFASQIKAAKAVVDGEVVAVDEEGRASFSLMQQRTGFRKWGRREVGDATIPIMY